MRIYTLVGKSGTGKSFHAMELCHEKNIESIIDDGLFICKNTVIAGSSAKRASTKIGAVKKALFIDEEECARMREAIERISPESILILGTSDEMTDRIMDRLGLEKPPEDSGRRIKIEDITTEKERRRARQQREQLGKHVIPASSLQLKRNFAGYFMDPLRFFRGKGEGTEERTDERTVVRPTYSYLGEYLLSERVIDDIISCVAQKHPACGRVIYVGHSTQPESYELFVVLKIRHGFAIWEAAAEIQSEIKEMIEQMSAFNVSSVDVEIRGID